MQPSKQQALKLTYRGGADISCLFLLLLLFQQVDWPFLKARSQTYEKRLLACTHATTRPSLHGFSWNLIWIFFENLSRKLKYHENLTRIRGNLQKTYEHLWYYFDVFFLEWEMFQTKAVHKFTHTHILCSITFLPENRVIYILYSRTVHRLQYNTVHELWKLDNWGYKHINQSLLVST